MAQIELTCPECDFKALTWHWLTTPQRLSWMCPTCEQVHWLNVTREMLAGKFADSVAENALD
jgi:hypothetical protein